MTPFGVKEEYWGSKKTSSMQKIVIMWIVSVANLGLNTIYTVSPHHF